MDEPKAHPGRDQFGLRFDDRTQQVHWARGVRVMPQGGVFCQLLQAVQFAAMGKDLEGSDAQVRSGDASQNSAGQGAFFAEDIFACCDGGKRACCRHAQSMHRFGDDVFTQDGTKPSASVAHAAVRGWPRAFELNVPAVSGRIHHLAQQ